MSKERHVRFGISKQSLQFILFVRNVLSVTLFSLLRHSFARSNLLIFTTPTSTTQFYTHSLSIRKS